MTKSSGVASYQLFGERARAFARAEELGAFISHRVLLRGEDPRRAAEGKREGEATPDGGAQPLAGLVAAVKDNIDVEGFPTSAGTPALEGRYPAKDAAIVASARAAGAILVAKANLHELSLGVTSTNAHFGAVKNPVDSSCVAGGSSGGSAVACAVGAVDFAFGTDTGGSARIPAAFCGVQGFRPTLGRYPNAGIIGLSSSRDTAGVLSARIDVIMRVDQVVTGDEDQPTLGRPLRLGVPAYAWRNLAPQVREVCEREVARLEASGNVIVQVGSDEVFLETARIADSFIPWEAPLEIARYLGETGAVQTFEQVEAQAASPDVQAFFEFVRSEPITATEYADYLSRLPALRETYLEIFASYGIDALIYPTVPFTAPPIGAESVALPDSDLPVFQGSIRNMEASTLVGTPSISIALPVGGMPVGMTWEMPCSSDRLLLSEVYREYEGAGATEQLHPEENHADTE